MSDNYDQFKTIMEENTKGHKVEIRYGESMTEGLPAVRLFIYRDYPLPGHLTVVTYGLSLANHQDWSEAKPELMICINTTDDPNWIGVIGMLADTGRKEGLAFEEGFSLLFNFPIGKSTGMKGLRVGGPAKLLVNPIALSDRRIVIKNVYPIYSGETDVIATDGWQRFVERVSENRLTDVKRADLSGGAGPDVQLSNEKLRELLSSVVLESIRELKRQGLVHQSDYYDGGMYSGPNFEGMLWIVTDIAVLLMSKVTKEVIVRGVTPPLMGQGCPRVLVSSVVDLVDLKLSPYAEVANLKPGHHDEKFFKLSWFRQSVSEFVAAKGAPESSGQKRVKGSNVKIEPDPAEESSERKKRWWEVWRK